MSSSNTNGLDFWWTAELDRGLVAPDHLLLRQSHSKMAVYSYTRLSKSYAYKGVFTCTGLWIQIRSGLNPDWSVHTKCALFQSWFNQCVVIRNCTPDRMCGEREHALSHVNTSTIHKYVDLLYIFTSAALCDWVCWCRLGGLDPDCVGIVSQCEQLGGGQAGHQDSANITRDGCRSWRCSCYPLPHLLGENPELCSWVCDLHHVWLRNGSLEYCSCKYVSSHTCYTFDDYFCMCNIILCVCW